MRSISDRRQILKTAGRCYVCLRVGHLSRNCRSRNKCPQCNGRHQLSICEGSSHQDNNTTSADPPLQSQIQSSSSLNLQPRPLQGTPPHLAVLAPKTVCCFRQLEQLCSTHPILRGSGVCPSSSIVAVRDRM